MMNNNQTRHDLALVLATDLLQIGTYDTASAAGVLYDVHYEESADAFAECIVYMAENEIPLRSTFSDEIRLITEITKTSHFGSCEPPGWFLRGFENFISKVAARVLNNLRTKPAALRAGSEIILKLTKGLQNSLPSGFVDESGAIACLLMIESTRDSFVYKGPHRRSEAIFLDVIAAALVENDAHFQQRLAFRHFRDSTSLFTTAEKLLVHFAARAPSLAKLVDAAHASRLAYKKEQESVLGEVWGEAVTALDVFKPRMIGPERKRSKRPRSENPHAPSSSSELVSFDFVPDDASSVIFTALARSALQEGASARPWMSSIRLASKTFRSGFDGALGEQLALNAEIAATFLDGGKDDKLPWMLPFRPPALLRVPVAEVGPWKAFLCLSSTSQKSNREFETDSLSALEKSADDSVLTRLVALLGELKSLNGGVSGHIVG